MEKKFELPAVWQAKWQQAGFGEPTMIQQAAFAPLAAGENVMGISPTGSGKTIAYLLPLMQRVKKGGGNQLLILTSSQELAMQVFEVAKDWGQSLELTVQSLIGGANVKRQIEKLKQKPEVLVGTPGRVLELMKQKKIKSHLLTSVVLDEADQLLDQSSLELVKAVLRQLPKEIQFSFFSATADAAIQTISQISQRPLTEIDLTETDDSQGEIKHYYLIYPARRKVDELRRLINLTDFRGLLFFNQLSELGTAEEKLLYHHLPVASLASDQSKQLRKMALDLFRTGKLAALLTTDVAARGLDITDLTYVINADVPLTKESYLHRAGRVGRMGRNGIVITLIHESEKRALKKLGAALALPINQIYLYDGQLQLEKKNNELVKKEKATVFEKKLEIHEKLHTNRPKRPNTKQKKKKKQKDKGKKRF